MIVQVGLTASSTTTVCSNVFITVCATSVALHTEQCLPSVKPVVAQVASIASSRTSVCPLAAMIFSSKSSHVKHSRLLIPVSAHDAS